MTDRHNAEPMRSTRGFTMLETLVVVAIIVVLGGLAVMSLFNTQKSLYSLEMDGIAKEIYVAAQNHLSTAKAQGVLGITTQGEQEEGSEDIYYYVVSEGSVLAPSAGAGSPAFSVASTDLAQMLPFGSIDETVRLGGSYVIRYQKNTETARVLDVFYADPHGQFPAEFAGSVTSKGLVNTYSGADNDARLSYPYNGRNDGIIGWWGGENGVASLASGELQAPFIEVENAERLRIKVTDTNLGSDLSPNLKLRIEGVTSGAVAVITLRDGAARTWLSPNYDNVSGIALLDLDDVTNVPGHRCPGATSGHLTGLPDSIFQANGNGQKVKFTPGEDLRIQAIADTTSALASEAKSAMVITNSLFDSITQVSPSEGAAPTHQAVVISSVRHLENLGYAISGYNAETLTQGMKVAEINAQSSEEIGGQSLTSEQLGLLNGSSALNVIGAEQVNDLSWNNFRYALLDDSFVEAAGGLETTVGGVKQVVPLEREEIADWCANSSDAKAVSIVGASGSSLTSGAYMPVSAPENLNSAFALNYNGNAFRIADVVVNVNGNAGLFGELKNGSVKDLELVDFNILSIDGRAGALAGSMTDATVEGVLVRNEPASFGADAGLKIAGAGDVGGLVGSMQSGSVNACAAAVYVQSTRGNAGGLVGSAAADSDASITNSYSGGHTQDGRYSTSAARNTQTQTYLNVQGYSNAGGLVGLFAGNEIINCYSTSSAASSANNSVAGGLVGTVSSGAIENCYATGLVQGAATTTTGAFVGKHDGGSIDGNNYYLDYLDTADSDVYGENRPAVGNEDTTAVKMIDDDLASYTEYVNGARAAVCYDPTLSKRYLADGTVVYPFKDIKSLSGSAFDNALTVHLETHFGDWPSPGKLVVNR